ncbi:unnamed protein product, partial [Leptidea sinapis]
CISRYLFAFIIFIRVAIVRIKDSTKSNADGVGKKESKKKGGKQKSEDHSVTNNKKDKLAAAARPDREAHKRVATKDETVTEASPENSRNASPRYLDTSMDDASDAGSLFRVAGAGAATVKSELVARGGSGGALALSRAPVGGSASPAPAPLPQPAPSPAPAALPPPALPPPPFRADTPHRPSAAHIPALDGQAATQVPARPVGAAGPDLPERPAGHKLQPGARAAADSPTPAPPAPPAPSPLFPSHPAYQSHAAAALPDYRHTNHETRTEQPPTEQAHAPLDLHAHHSSPRPPHIAPTPVTQPSHPSLPNRVPLSQPQTVITGHDVRNVTPVSQTHTPVPTSYPNRIGPGVPQNLVPQMPMPTTTGSTGLPSQSVSTKPASPAPPSRPYPPPIIGSSHVNSTINSSIHNLTMPYQSQPSLQKHSVPPIYTGRPPHLAPFSVANHLTSSHLPSSTSHLPTTLHLSHPINSHSVMSHAPHVPVSSHPALVSTPNHPNQALFSTATVTSTISSLTPHLKQNGMSLPPQLATPTTSQQTVTHMYTTPISSAPTVVAPVSSSNSLSHSIPTPIIDTRHPVVTTEIQSRTESLIVSSSPSSNSYPPAAVYSNAYPTLYAPYAPNLQHSPYLPPSAASPRNTIDTRTSHAASPLLAPKTPKGVRPHTPGSLGAAGVHTPLLYSPRTQSPNRERESFSNISSLSRSTPAAVVSAPVSMPSLAPTLTAPLAAPLAAPLSTPLAAPLSTPLAAPLAGPVPTLAGTIGGLAPSIGAVGGLGLAPLATPTPTAPAPAPHLAHSLAPVPTVPSISSSPGADLLRRELDSRFLAAAGAAGVRTELHHHQHQHTHVHQHPSHAHPPHAAHPSHHPHAAHHPHQLLFKDMGKMSSLYRSGLSLYPYSSSLLHPAAPYVPPAPLTTYAPKKTGKWNAMHVRIAWEIYNHQQKEKSGPGGLGSLTDKDKLRSFPAPPPPAYRSPYELPAPYLGHAPLGLARHPARGYPPPDRDLAVSGVSPFTRYAAGPYPGAPPFGLPYGRELALSSSLHGVHHPPIGSLHDAWRGRPPVSAAAEVRREHEERERARRDREERERRERDERERRKAREQRERELERARARSPLRPGAPELKEERKDAARAYPPHWDPYRAAFDPLQHMRFAPLVEAAIRAEEDRAKMFSAYHHHQLKAGPLLHRPPLPPHAPLDLLKKEEPR